MMIVDAADVGAVTLRRGAVALRRGGVARRGDAARARVRALARRRRARRIADVHADARAASAARPLAVHADHCRHVGIDGRDQVRDVVRAARLSRDREVPQARPAGPEVVEERFGGMYRAFQYGAPPHGGMAAGIDRMVMLLVGAKNLREVALFPMNQQANDLLMGAPSEVTPKQLRELHIRAVPPAKS